MTRISDFRRLFREAFNVSPDWNDWFFEKVYNDDEAMFLNVDGKAVSALMAEQRRIQYHGTTLPLAYLSCVATARAERGKGHMRRLLTDAITAAATRGDALAALIPASRHLYFFYDKFDFATVFYTDELRYTALHTFADDNAFANVEPAYPLFRRLEDRRAGSVLHDQQQYSHVLTDLAFDGGSVPAVSDGNGDEAIAFVTTDAREATVTDILATSPRAAEAVMARVRDIVGPLPIVVHTVPTDCPATLRARGMIRILDVAALLTALASAHPRLRHTIRVHDPIIPANNATFTIADGLCAADTHTPGHLDLDVNIDILARILFSAPATGSIFNLPTARPYISLMLD